MAEPLPEPTPPTTLVDRTTRRAELARRNLRWGWALFGLFFVLFARHGRRRARLPLAGLSGRESTSRRSVLAAARELASGIRLAVKDLFDTAGIRTTYGSAVFAEHVPAETAEWGARLEAARAG